MFASPIFARFPTDLCQFGMRTIFVFPLWHTSPSSLDVFRTEVSFVSPCISSSSGCFLVGERLPRGRLAGTSVASRETLEFRTLSLCASRLAALDAELMLSLGGRGHGLSLVGYWIASFCGDRL